MNQRVEVNVPGKRYYIHLGRGLLSQSPLYPAAAHEGRAIIVSNETIAPLYLDQVQGAIGESLIHILPDGEQYKSMAQCQKVLDTMLKHKMGRDSIVIALGGGVVGDMAGFAAAIYQRGISLLQIPTTLLSQVDSSVGGKTAVNHRRGKNMIGSFHQPQAVITDLSTLDTLPEREFRAGVAEVIKYGLLGDKNFFHWLQANIDALLNRDDKVLIEAIANSCHHKATVVAADEKEQGRRALLNLGHTFGHAIEAHMRYKEWLHGEAVGTGMCMAADLSHRHGWISANDKQACIDLIEHAGLPIYPPKGLTATRMKKLMQGDKKTAAGRVRLVLLQAIGDSLLCNDYDDRLLDETLQAYCHP